MLSIQEIKYHKPAHDKQKGLFGGFGGKKDKKKKKKSRRIDDDSDEDSDNAESTEKDAAHGTSEPRTR